MSRLTVFVLFCALATCQVAHANLIVFVDFTSDNRGPSGSDWIENLAAVTAAAGVDPFTATERGMIQTSILSRLDAAYSAYNVTFSTSNVGSNERIQYGAFSATAGNLGVAPLDFMNLFGNTTAQVFSNNFDFIIDEFSGSVNRANQIEQLSAALAGTGAHELGHAVGLSHHHAYGIDAISPANYANTLGAQNTEIMATGSTGLDEAGREMDRTFGRMSNLMLEAAGGGNPAGGGTGTSLATTVLMQTNSDFGPGDTGNTTATATALSLTSLPISQLRAANTLGDLESGTDLDVYSFTVDGPTSLWAQLWSANRYTQSFDGILRLIGTDGLTILASNDDVRYDGNVFNGGTQHELDPALLNIPLLAAGTYYLEVSSESTTDPGMYALIFGAGGDMMLVPEPSSLALALVGCVAFGLALRRRKLSDSNEAR